MSSTNPYQSPEPTRPASSPQGRQAHYQDVVWYRQSGFASAMVVAGFCCFPPLLLAVCIVLVTGDVYYNKLRKDGTLKKWSIANKILAWLVLAWNLYIIYEVFVRPGGN